MANFRYQSVTVCIYNKNDNSKIRDWENYGYSRLKNWANKFATIKLDPSHDLGSTINLIRSLKAVDHG